MRHRCCGYRRQWEPQGPLDPTVWWYMNTTGSTVGTRANDGPTPKKFFGSWNEFENVLSGNVTGPQGCECGLECTMSSGEKGICQADHMTCAVNLSPPNCLEITSPITRPPIEKTTTTRPPIERSTTTPTTTRTTTTTTVPIETTESGVNGEWGSWGAWASCSKTCGGGTRSRQRNCDSPPPSGLGDDCVGPSTETERCNTNSCPAPCVDKYPSKYSCKKTHPCSKLRKSCKKTWRDALPTKCEKKMSKGDLRKRVNTFCKKTCNTCSSRSDGRMGGESEYDYYY